MRIIRGKYGRRRFQVPKGIEARPTTDMARENVMNIIENMVDMEGARCLDLFAGTGAVTFELLSRGAASVTAVEMAAPQCRFITKVAAELGEQNLALVRGDVKKWLKGQASGRGGQGYDLIFCDPPYDMEGFEEIPRRVLEAGLLAPGGVFVMEHGKNRDFSGLPGFLRHRAYGSVNFSIFQPSGDGEEPQTQTETATGDNSVE